MRYNFLGETRQIHLNQEDSVSLLILDIPPHRLCMGESEVIGVITVMRYDRREGGSRAVHPRPQHNNDSGTLKIQSHLLTLLSAIDKQAPSTTSALDNKESPRAAITAGALTSAKQMERGCAL